MRLVEAPPKIEQLHTQATTNKTIKYPPHPSNILSQNNSLHYIVFNCQFPCVTGCPGATGPKCQRLR